MIRTLSSQQKYRNAWLSVREDEVEFENGHRGIYGVIEKSDFVVVIPFDGEHFYLVQQYRYPLGQELLEFPQGKHENNPTEDPASLAAAELEEETGLRAGKLEHIGIFHPAPGHLQQVGHIYLATELVQGEQKLDPTEADLQVHKVSSEELKRLVGENSITDGPTLVAYNFLQNTRFALQ